MMLGKIALIAVFLVFPAQAQQVRDASLNQPASADKIKAHQAYAAKRMARNKEVSAFIAKTGCKFVTYSAKVEKDEAPTPEICIIKIAPEDCDKTTGRCRYRSLFERGQ